MRLTNFGLDYACHLHNASALNRPKSPVLLAGARSDRWCEEEQNLFTRTGVRGPQFPPCNMFALHSSATPCASELKNFRNRTGCGCGIQMFRLALIGSKLSHSFGKHIPIGKRESYAACAGSNGAQALKLFTNLWVCLEHLVSWLGSHSDIACSFIRHNFLRGTCRFNTRELLMLLTCEHRLTSVGSCWT